ncbi:hypothetical protein ACP70R_022955 [Stipagrostis hirtigluma subsp. patula]
MSPDVFILIIGEPQPPRGANPTRLHRRICVGPTRYRDRAVPRNSRYGVRVGYGVRVKERTTPLSIYPLETGKQNRKRNAESLIAAISSAAALPATGDYPVLRDDPRGFPRALRLLAALVEAEAHRSAAAAAESDLAQSFRGGAGATTPTISIGDFLERIQFFIRFEGSCYAVAGVYLIRFLRSPAAWEAGVPVGPHTTHRLVATAFFLATKFVGPLTAPTKVFEVSSCGAIRAGEMEALECAFPCALGCRLFVHVECFEWFCGVL